MENSIIFNLVNPLAEEPSWHIETVYESQDGYTKISRTTIDGKNVLLKSLKERYFGSPLYERLLKKEYEIGKGLVHPGICQTIDFRDIPGLGACIVLEWIEGQSLASILEPKELDAVTSRKIILELCDALDFIHHRQVVHKDIKPENIMITGNGHNVKIIDFGFSDADSYAVLKLAAGTRSYASPEQISGGRIDERSDIYSFGKVIASISEYLTGVQRRFWKSISRKCTNLNPDKRIGSVRLLKDAILRRERLRRQIPFLITFSAATAAVLLWIAAPYLRRAYKRHQIDNMVEMVTNQILK